ncbi:hypothetical protein MESS2_1700010 [Mesorhizobium metallidurans STM 2683]|uniref:Uncharacterized protein n=1 Tax=Mesorhizobium metallidurans STM 2683 TaxID=1297569 RepID=M5EP47_9HYPH|nr:hypothetical protein MESS2_1700010 [Mesorhizobium metallidurans STM 2683]
MARGLPVTANSLALYNSCRRAPLTYVSDPTMVRQNERFDFCLLAPQTRFSPGGWAAEPDNADVPRKYPNFRVYEIRES